MELFSFLRQESALVLLGEAEEGQLVTSRRRGQPLLHVLKVDKKGDVRTCCGVRLGDTGAWVWYGYKILDDQDINCPTCQSALAKLAHGRFIQEGLAAAVASFTQRGIPEATERASSHRAVCLAVQGDTAFPSPRTHGQEHVPSVLKTDYNGEVIPVWCTWCGATLDQDAGTSLPPSAQVLDTDPTDMIYLNHGTAVVPSDEGEQSDGNPSEQK